jgi:AcrR family transcriptional regulator
MVIPILEYGSMLNKIRVREPDGRRERSEASRERIVRAMLDLVGEGQVTPSAEDVAARAKVGLRTVFRHFDNMESLYRQLDAVIVAEVQPIADAPYKAADWRGRLSELVERRARIFERIMPYKIAGEVHRHQSAFLDVQQTSLVRELRLGVNRVLPDALRKDRDLLECVDLTLSFDVWRRLRKDQGLSAARAKQVVEKLLEQLLRR